MARRLELEYVADTSGFTRGTRQVRGELDQLDKTTERSTKRVRGGLTRTGAAVAGFAGGVASQFAGRALDAVANFASGTITAASDYQETLSKSRAIFGDQATSVERWASAGAKSFGLAKSDALAYAASLGDMASQLGFTGKQSAAFGQDLVQVSADLGSFNNLETGDVLDRISAAMRGEYDSLQALIPNINAARVEQEALAATGKKTAKELTAQEKALAVQAILHKDGARAMGDFARTSGGFANQQKIAAAQVQDLQAKLGTALLPILATVMTFITTTAIPAIERFATWFGSELGPQVVEFGQSMKGILPIVQGFGSFLADNAQWLLPVATGVAAIVGAVRLWTIAQAALNFALSANPIGLVVIAIGALVGGLIYAYQNSETFRNVVNGAFTAVRNVVVGAMEASIRAVRSIGEWFVRTYQASVNFVTRVVRSFHLLNSRIVSVVRGLVSSVVSWFTNLRDRAVRAVLQLGADAVRAVTRLRDNFVRGFLFLRDRSVAAVLGLRDRAMAFLVSLRDRFLAGVRYLRDRSVAAILGLRDRSVAAVIGLRDRAMAFVLNLRDRGIAGFRILRDRAVEAVQALRERAIARVIALRDTVVRVAGQVRDRALAPFRALRNAAGDIFRGLRDTVGRAFGGLLDRVRGPLRTVFNWLNRNLIGPLDSVTSKFGLNIPDLPRFHQGGVVGGRGEVPAVLLGGEGVLNRQAMRGIGGPKGLDMLNAGGPGDWLKNFTEFISTPAKLLAGMAEKGVKWAVSQVLGAIPAIPQTGVPIVDAVPGLLNNLKSNITSWASRTEAQEQAALGAGATGSIGSGPWVKPVAAGIGNGYLGYPGHYGVDMPVGTGTPVHAVSNAIVSKAASLTGSYGRHLMLRHADGLVTVYAHLSQLLTSVGQRVRTGQVIGRSGNTGNSTGPHLHFETRVGGGYPGPNPRSVMRARGVTLDTGGMLQPGLTLVNNATGGPEPVLNKAQWDGLTRSRGEMIEINIYGPIDKEATAREIRSILAGSDTRRRGVRVNRRAS